MQNQGSLNVYVLAWPGEWAPPWILHCSAPPGCTGRACYEPGRAGIGIFGFGLPKTPQLPGEELHLSHCIHPAELSHGLDSPETRLVWASQAPFRTVTPGLNELVSVSSHHLQSPWVMLTFQSRSMDQHRLVLVRNADPQACPRPQSESAFWQGPPLLPPWHGPCYSPWGSQQKAWQSSFAENAPLVPLQRLGLIPGQGTMIPRAAGSKKEKKKWGPGGQGALNVVQGYLPLTDPVSMFFWHPSDSRPWYHS